jgi:hypothetical protein
MSQFQRSASTFETARIERSVYQFGKCADAPFHVLQDGELFCGEVSRFFFK